MSKAKLIMTIADMEKDRNKWLELRNKGIGGSDAGAIMGMNPYKSRLSLWLEKTGQKEPEDLSDNEAVYWGNTHEPNIAKRFTEVTGKKVRKCGMMQSIDYPFLFASVDRMVEGENAGLEIKTAGVKQAARWKGDEVPDEYYCQCQHYMLVTGCEKWYIAVLIGGNHFEWKEVVRHDAFIRDLLTAEAAFWTLVENNIMPDVDGLESTKDALNIMYPQATATEELLEIESTEKLEEIFNEYNRYKKLSKEIGTLMTEYENKIKVLMGDNARAVIGEHKASWINMPGKVTADLKRLKEEQPDIYEKYTKVGNPFRKFSMK